MTYLTKRLNELVDARALSCYLPYIIDSLMNYNERVVKMIYTSENEFLVQ